MIIWQMSRKEKSECHIRKENKYEGQVYMVSKDMFNYAVFVFQWGLGCAGICLASS